MIENNKGTMDKGWVEEKGEMNGDKKKGKTVPRLVHSVSVAEFDELQGNTLSLIFPKSPKPKIVSHTKEAIAELCLPDGGHRFEDDSVYILLRGESSDGKNEIPLYGYAFFRNKPDEREKRGARQVALLIISTAPHYDLFRPFLTVAMEEFLDREESRMVIRSLYYALEEGFRKTMPSVHEEGDDGTNGQRKPLGRGCGGLLQTNTYAMQLWNRMFVIQPLASLGANEFGGASLKDLVLLFRERTMCLWYAIVTEQRLLICGQNVRAETVGNLVLATPLLVGCLGSLIVPDLTPYVTLANVEPVTRRKYICGTTNGLFSTKTQWFDMLADAKTGKVSISENANSEKQGFHKVQGGDLSFIQRIISGLESGRRDEQWVRFEFSSFTKYFLDGVRELEAERSQKRELEKENHGIGFGNNTTLRANNSTGRLSHHSSSSSSNPKQSTPPNTPPSANQVRLPRRLSYEDHKKKAQGNTPPNNKTVHHHHNNVTPAVATKKPGSGGGLGGTGVNTSPTTTRAFGKNRRRPKWLSKDWVKQATKHMHLSDRKSNSDRIAENFSLSGLWLRYRWMQLNPESIDNARQLARVHSIDMVKSASMKQTANTKLADALMQKHQKQLQRQGDGQMVNGVDLGAYSNATPPPVPPRPTTIQPTLKDGVTSSGNWVNAIAPDGTEYVWNIETNESRILTLDPSGDDTPEPCNKNPKWVFRNGRWIRRTSSEAAAASNGDNDRKGVAETSKWIETTTGEGETYWWNPSTNETTWNNPCA